MKTKLTKERLERIRKLNADKQRKAEIRQIITK